MNLGCDVGTGQPRDLRDVAGVEPFEVEEHHLPVDRFQLMDETDQSLHREPAIELSYGIHPVRPRVQFVEAGERGLGAAANHLGDGDVVRDAVSPGTEGAAPVKAVEALPEREVNVLQQIAAGVGMRFVSASETAQGRTVGSRGFTIEAVLFRQGWAPLLECSYRR